jgi:hypothetical protein
MAKETISVTRKQIALQSSTPKANLPLQSLLNPPLEITRAKLGGLNMVDETIIIRKSLRTSERSK